MTSLAHAHARVLSLRPAEHVRVQMRMSDRWRMERTDGMSTVWYGFKTPEGSATTGAPTVYGLCCMHSIGGLTTTPSPPHSAPPNSPPSLPVVPVHDECRSVQYCNWGVSG